MYNISSIYNVSFKSDINNKNQITSDNIKTSDIPNDSFEIKKNDNSNCLLGLLRNLFSPPPEQKYKKFILNAEKKIEYASSDFKKINKNSVKLFNEANELLIKVKNDNLDENIQTNAVNYQGDIYRTIRKIDTDGFVDKIIHTKNNQVYTVYDIKSELKAGKNQIYEGNQYQKVTADCYFYNPFNENKSEIGYMKNVTNTAVEFNAAYDAEHGGIKRVCQNSNKTPIEVYASGTDKNYTYWFNYGKKEQEKVSHCILGDDKSRTKYTKIKQSIFKKYNKIISYFQYENVSNRPKSRLVIVQPKIRIQDYSIST